MTAKSRASSFSTLVSCAGSFSTGARAGVSELGGLGLAEGREKVEAWAQARHRRSPFWCDRARGAGRRLGNRSRPAIVTTAESSSFKESQVRSVSTHGTNVGELY